MEEEKVQEEAKVEEKVDIIEVAKKRTEDLKRANEELEAQIKKHDKLVTEAYVKGNAFAGQKERTAEDDVKDEAEKIANALGRSFK